MIEDRRGATALEFAIVAVVFFFMVFGIIDIGRYGATQHALQTVASDAARSLIINCGGRLEATCTAVTLPSNEGSVAPLAYVGGPPAIAAIANPSDYTIKVTVTSASPFSAILPPLSALNGAMSASATLNYCMSGLGSC